MNEFKLRLEGQIEEIKINIEKIENDLQERAVLKQFNLSFMEEIMKLNALKEQQKALKYNLDIIITREKMANKYNR